MPVMIQKLELLPALNLPGHQQPRTGFPPPGLRFHPLLTQVLTRQLEL